MTILLKNKHTVRFDDFKFKCCIGKNGLTKFKKEGDGKTPKGTFKIEHLYFRKDRIKKPSN
jgi:L,D-peptidoglycan transpeptidase YkuD (ErfK/YbiS/YcfS/YnhG family)